MRSETQTIIAADRMDEMNNKLAAAKAAFVEIGTQCGYIIAPQGIIEATCYSIASKAIAQIDEP